MSSLPLTQKDLRPISMQQRPPSVKELPKLPSKPALPTKNSNKDVEQKSTRPPSPSSSNNTNTFKFSKSQEELLEVMKKGEMMYKVPRADLLAPTLTRVFVTDDLQYIAWTSKKKNQQDSQFPLCEIDEVQRGQDTNNFQKHKKKFSKLLETHFDSSFSLVGPERTIDLMCTDLMQIDTWIKGLQILIQYAKSLPKPERPIKKKMGSFSFGTPNVGFGAAADAFSVAAPPLEKKKSEPDAKKGNKFLNLFQHHSKETNATTTTTTTEPLVPPSAETLAHFRTHPTVEVKHASQQHKNSSPSEKHLFEFVVVVSIRETADKKMEPFISYTFPPSLVQKKDIANMMKTIPLFCFPDVEMLEKSDKMQSSCFGIFCTILDTVEARNSVNSVAVFSFLKAVLAKPFPERGESVIVKSQNPKTGTMEEVKLQRPDASDPMVEYVDFSSFFAPLSAEQIISVFAALMLERRIIFISKDISVLSACTHAVVAALYPFTWQHVFIPVMPRSLLEYCCSPTPFLVGVLAIHMHIVLSLPLEEVLLVDMDNAKLTGFDDAKLIPDAAYKALRTTLQQILQKGKANAGKIATQEVSEAFSYFFATLFNNFTPHVKKSSKGYQSFDVDSFVKNKNYKAFYEAFSQSQMFERWIYELEL